MCVSTTVSERLDYTFSNHITRIRVKKNRIFPHWVYLLFLRYKERFVFRAICHTHVGQSGIGKAELQNLRIFFPPINEQQNIASILSKVDELIQKTDHIIEQTQRLKKGLMQRLLTKGIGHTKHKRIKSVYHTYEEIPEEWQLISIDKMIKNKDDIKTGPFGSSLKKEIFVASGYKVYGQENVIPDDFNVGNYYVSEETFRKL
ncbi:MAG: restriction endonuclease subunit S [Thermoproteota archaeon]|nr:restriction endonuclease subunit S [Thermoproteota archaeon]